MGAPAPGRSQDLSLDSGGSGRSPTRLKPSAPLSQRKVDLRLPHAGGLGAAATEIIAYQTQTAELPLDANASTGS